MISYYSSVHSPIASNLSNSAIPIFCFLKFLLFLSNSLLLSNLTDNAEFASSNYHYWFALSIISFPSTLIYNLIPSMKNHFICFDSLIINNSLSNSSISILIFFQIHQTIVILMSTLNFILVVDAIIDLIEYFRQLRHLFSTAILP